VQTKISIKTISMKFDQSKLRSWVANVKLAPPKFVNNFFTRNVQTKIRNVYTCTNDE